MRPFHLSLVSVLAIFWLGQGRAVAAPQISAHLSSTSVTQGDIITLWIEVTEAQVAAAPDPAPIDGLTIQFLKAAQSGKNVNGRVERGTELIFALKAQRSGTYQIPPIAVRTTVGVLQTESLQLAVRNIPVNDPERPAEFAQLLTTKTRLYVGEVVPMEVRLFVEAETRFRMDQPPSISGDGFTKQSFLRPREERVRRGGRDYVVQVFRTTIAPSKAGKLTLGPSEVKFLTSKPRTESTRSNSGSGFYFESTRTYEETKELVARAEALELEVKSPPAEGRPKDFSGAIGQFQFSAQSSLKTLKVGDPLTMQLTISGEGNFDRVMAPVLADPVGWHSYPSNSEFEPLDDLAFSGTKTFEVPVVPEVKKSATPIFEFSYFDPEAEKYVTLRSEAEALLVTGDNPAPAPPAPTLTARSAEPPPSAAPEEKAPAADILGLKYEMGPRRASFDPIYRSTAFWIAQGVPLLGLLGLLGFRLAKKGENQRQQAALRQERAGLWQQLRATTISAELFELATRLVQIEVALQTGSSPASVDLETIQRSRSLDEETLAGLNEIFASRAELLYAGAARPERDLIDQDKTRVITTLTRFGKSHGQS